MIDRWAELANCCVNAAAGEVRAGEPHIQFQSVGADTRCTHFAGRRQSDEPVCKGGRAQDPGKCVASNRGGGRQRGAKALAAPWSAQEHYDLVLLDVQMPEMDGLDSDSRIRHPCEQENSRTGRHLPIVALTAHAMKGDRERCLAAGMDAYLSKPLRAAGIASRYSPGLLPCRSLRRVARRARLTWSQADDGAGPPGRPGRGWKATGNRRGRWSSCFPNQSPKLLDKIRRRRRHPADCARALEKTAHKLKGLTGNSGRNRLSRSPRALNRWWGRNGDFAGAEEGLRNWENRSPASGRPWKK